MKVLDVLADNRIFSIEKVDGEYIFTECCDYYYTYTLNESEMKQLISELTELTQE